MQLTFSANSPTVISFKLTTAGTSSIPSAVSVVLQKDNKSLSFAALQNGEEWQAVVDNPALTFGCGQVKVQISAVLNGHIFTPFKADGEIIDSGIDNSAQNQETDFIETDVITSVPPQDIALPQQSPELPIVSAFEEVIEVPEVKDTIQEVKKPVSLLKITNEQVDKSSSTTQKIKENTSIVSIEPGVFSLFKIRKVKVVTK